MLIEVGADIIAKAGTGNKDAIEVLEQLANAYKYNKHLIFLSPEQRTLIKDIRYLSSNSKAIYKGMKVSGLNSIRDKVEITAIISSINPNNANKLWINPEEHKAMEFFEETHLLVENLLDEKFFKKVVECYQTNNKLQKLSICYYPLHGGGGTTKTVYIKEIELKQHFCLAILDSDKKYPGDKYGQTSEDLRSIHDSENPFNCGYYRMECVSEIENLIPISVIDKFGYKTNANPILQIRPLSYVDMKKGVVCCNIINQEMYDYVLNLLNSIGLGDKLEKCKECLSNCKFKVNKKTKEECMKSKTIVDGFGSNLLSNLLNEGECIGKLEKIRKSDLTNDQLKEWNKIGRIIFEWCCCAEEVKRV